MNTPKDLGIVTEKPKYPAYAIRSKRVETFANWPSNSPVTVSDLADAGLVYTGVKDSVRCYHCGGGLRNWEEGDLPILEHTKWYPRCPHILLLKGKDFVDKVATGFDPRSTRSTDEDLQSPAAKSCLFMGFDEKQVSKSISMFRNRYVGKEYAAKDLYEILVEEDEDDSQPKASRRKSSLETDKKTVAELLEENRELREKLLCKICCEGNCDIVFLPCGHKPACAMCSVALIKCPICRKVINGLVKAKFAENYI